MDWAFFVYGVAAGRKYWSPRGEWIVEAAGACIEGEGKWLTPIPAAAKTAAKVKAGAEPPAD